MTTLTAPRPPRAGSLVAVTMPDGYTASGKFLGLSLSGGRPVLRVLGRDLLERHIPSAGATVTRA